MTRIVCWNVLNQNYDIPAFHSLISAIDADVYVLQELNAHHISALDGYADFTLRTAMDFLENGNPAYLGILSRLPTKDANVLVHNPHRRPSPSWFGKRQAWSECIESQSLFVDAKPQGFRLVNVHLTCGCSPRVRAALLEEIVPHFEQDARVVLCGDFNTFARPWINPFIAWAFGFNIHDLSVNERHMVRNFAQDHDMHMALDGAVTFPKLKLQLDNVLVRGLDVKTCYVEHKCYGSDHRPVVTNL